MDRSIVYPGSIPLDTDLLNTNRHALVALGALMGAVLGTDTVIDGLAVVPTMPASLTVTVAPGSITAIGPLDQSAFGTLAADPSNVVRMGVNLQPTSLVLTAPPSSGQSIAWLIEAAFVENDADALVLPYYNAANPAQPWLGPANSGGAQPTTRQQRVALQARAGVAAPTGSQVPPAVDQGWVGVAVVRVSYGQSAVGAADIAVYPQAPTVPFRLPQLRPGFAALQSFGASGTFVVPPGVQQIKVTVIGGGGAGGTHATLPGGGGGAGGRAMKILVGLTPGNGVSVTVGAGGVASSAPAAGGPGGTSSFGSFVSATGGGGGDGGTNSTPSAGGAGGAGVGGDVNEAGSSGTDCVLQAGRGGDGGGPGAGRGATGVANGIAAGGAGGGGGGGGSTPGGGTGAQGGNGAPGLVIVEY